MEFSQKPDPAGERRSLWGEGPFWWNNTLYYVDIEEHEIVSFDPMSGSEKTWNVGQRIGCAAPRQKGGLVIAGDHGIGLFDFESGITTPVADPEPDKTDNRFNDGKCDTSGRLWAGTISLSKKTGDAALYRLDKDRNLELVLDNITNSNGLAWNADNNRFYYIDTPTKEIRAYMYDTEQGTIGSPRVIMNTERSEIIGSPDGMSIDTEGNLWIAMCHGGCVVCVDPENGKLIGKLKLPCVETTSCAFGGPKLENLYVTTGIKPGLEEPHAGRLFVFPNVGVRGVETNVFAG